MPEMLNLTLNQKLSISKDGVDWYTTSVQEYGEDRFSIAMPYQKSQPLILYRGENVTVRFAGENASYQFKTRVMGRTEDRIPLYVLAMPKKVDRIQQRKFVRIPISIPVKYAVEPDGDEKPEFKEAFTVNLSAGGMKLALKAPFKEGATLLLRFQLEIKEQVLTFELKGKIVRLEVKELKDKRRVYHAGIEFLDISRNTQDKIMRFIFARMAKQNQLR